MRRRDFIILLGGAATTGGLHASHAQQPAKVHRIAIVHPAALLQDMSETGDNSGYRALFQELRRLGYVEGQNLIVERYSAEGRQERFDALAREVVSTNPELVHATSNPLVNWSVAQMRDVIGRALKPFEMAGQDRFVYSGPVVWVPAQPSLTLTMCLHELATNAAKYGALSNGTGHVHISWDLVEPRQLKLTWQEAGGPLVVPPAHAGFGSRLIEASFGNEEACLDFRPDGLRCSFDLPL